MKTLLHAFLAFVLIFNANHVLAQSEPSMVSVVLIDKTSSVTNDTEVQEKNQRELIALLGDRISQTGDRIIVSYIYSSSAQYSNRYEVVFDPPKEPNLEDLSSLKKERAILEHQLLLKRYKKSFAKKVLGMCFSGAIDQKETNIFGSLKIIADVRGDYPTADISVYIFSDLCECSNFKKYYCQGGSTFSGYHQAEAAAKKDLEEALTHYQISKKSLKDITSVTMVLPSKRMDDNAAFELMPYYWKKVFYQLGITKITIK